MSRTIRILGGGISGLTAAIHLRKAGFHVEVHERKSRCGKGTNDFQFLENWCFEEDALQYLRRIRMDTDFYVKPWYSQEFFSPTLRRYSGRSVRPLMYLVKRGQAEDTLDSSLETQAIGHEVRICYESNLKRSEAHIVATGLKKPTFIATGVRFGINGPDRSIVLLNNDLSSRFYSYLIVNDNTGQIVCVNPVGCTDMHYRLDKTLKAFEKILNTTIETVAEKFSSVVNFGFLCKAVVDSRYYVGEAAGFQDALAGFGMIYAFKSGHCAARSIAENVDYDGLWRKEFFCPLKISSRNRNLYNRLSNADFEKLIGMLNSRHPVLRRLRGGEDLRLIMRRVYTRPPFFFLLPLWLLAKTKMKR